MFIKSKDPKTRNQLRWLPKPPEKKAEAAIKRTEKDSTKRTWIPEGQSGEWTEYR